MVSKHSLKQGMLIKNNRFQLTGYASIAQLVEQRTENPCVGGSIPPGGTKI